ncbi:hypothetical protein ES332_D13G192300v1 [Gossypium tomentosum]|uniref:Bifunctional inhibitor/plant lipid transfer protein/seed storage helical domain-containing protein n=1 Tax=Gossypium tomentosum TaxID=34277 RepID=A0A5D2HZL4_GOSTO|nr:hypothetical protein ES332_D13G192300v1 [Gossypium tomentosum]
MGSKPSASTVFLLFLNLVFFSLVSSHTRKCPEDLSACPAAFGKAFFRQPPDPSCECCSQFRHYREDHAAGCVCIAIKSNWAFPIDLNKATKLFMRYCGFNNAVAFSGKGSHST